MNRRHPHIEPHENEATGERAASAGRAAKRATPIAPETEVPNQAMARAARALAARRGAEPVPRPVADEAAASGIDTGGIGLTRSEPLVGELGAGAVTAGSSVHFAPGRYRPGSRAGRALIMHELAHAAGATPVRPDGPLRLAAESDPAERAAARVSASVLTGRPVDQATVAAASAGPQTLHPGEAGVHQEITFEAMGSVERPGLGSLDNPNTTVDDSHGLGGLRHRDSENLTGEQRAALQIYAGNFMSDFSQANVPKLISILGSIPSATVPGGSIGAVGAGHLVQAIISAVAILDLGTEAGSLVTAATTEMYEAERHLDNPMGTVAEDYVIDNDDSLMSGVAQAPRAFCVETRPPPVEGPLPPLRNMGTVGTAPFGERQHETVETHGGSAVPGLQMENPELYRVSDGGLSTHLYNSIEASKRSYLLAVEAGPTPIGRVHTGYADHIIQDYFSHSNFIEVALNSHINDALRAPHDDAPGPAGAAPATAGQFYAAMPAVAERLAATRETGTGPSVDALFVDPLYDTPGGVPVRDEQGRLAITTGTFGSTDTLISLAHVFLPLMPKLHASIQRSIDELLRVIDTAPEQPGWAGLGEVLASQGRDGAALRVLLDGSDAAGVTVRLPTSIGLKPLTELALNPLAPFEVGYSELPVTSALSAFAGLHRTVQSIKDRVRSTLSSIGLTGLVERIDAAWDGLKANVGGLLKEKFRELQASIIDGIIQEISDGRLDADEVRTLTNDVLAGSMEGVNQLVHGAEGGTSIEERMASGDLSELTREELERRVGPVSGDGSPTNPWRPLNPLPPSHSEISKDHPPHNPAHHEHDEHGADADPEVLHPGSDPVEIFDTTRDDQERAAESAARIEEQAAASAVDGGGAGGFEHEHGSPFYGLAFALAVEAQRHMYAQLEGAWAEMMSDVDSGRQVADLTDADGLIEEAAPADVAGTRDDDMASDHESVLEQARHRAQAERRANERRGFQRVQETADAQEIIALAPSTSGLLDLVDLFISHPDDSTWWQPVMSSYIADHPAEVYHHILRRNETRLLRGRSVLEQGLAVPRAMAEAWQRARAHR